MNMLHSVTVLTIFELKCRSSVWKNLSTPHDSVDVEPSWCLNVVSLSFKFVVWTATDSLWNSFGHSLLYNVTPVHSSLQCLEPDSPSLYNRAKHLHLTKPHFLF